jgi:hypothetical protein
MEHPNETIRIIVERNSDIHEDHLKINIFPTGNGTGTVELLDECTYQCTKKELCINNLSEYVFHLFHCISQMDCRKDIIMSVAINLPYFPNFRVTYNDFKQSMKNINDMKGIIGPIMFTIQQWE